MGYPTDQDFEAAHSNPGPPSSAGYRLVFALRALRDLNLSRCNRWHNGRGVQDWSGLEWAGAMAGEAGEAANVAKKLKRLETGLVTGSQDRERHELVKKLGLELADTFLYLDLLAARYGIDLGHAIVEKFNQKSEEFGFPERL
jgi:NTP pyrophosphatase (non-canonical NTP hydrolase)